MNTFARGLALAFLDGDWQEEELLERGHLCLAARPRWMRPLCRRVLAAFPTPPRGRLQALVDFIAADRRLGDRFQGRRAPPVRRWFFPSSEMVPIGGRPAQFSVPPLANVRAVAAWLGLEDAGLLWFCDLAGLNARPVADRLRHYDFHFVRKRSGGVRLLEAPRSRMKALQRHLLRELLGNVPPHTAACGFVRGRGYPQFAAAHSGQRVVVRIDLEDFFASVGYGRVRAIFARLGYPDEVAVVLAGLCTLRTPADVLKRFPRSMPIADRSAAVRRLRERHLPQGAPTSPALSNLAAVPLDLRLSGLARVWGVRYSRYADDLAFSGDERLSAGVESLIARVAAIAIDEGFRVRYRKIRVMRSGHRQQLGGLVVNAATNVPRSEYDRLRALLHNAARTGPDAQNRDGHPAFQEHVRGRIAWVAATNASRGARLWEAYRRVRW